MPGQISSKSMELNWNQKNGAKAELDSDIHILIITEIWLEMHCSREKCW